MAKKQSIDTGTFTNAADDAEVARIAAAKERGEDVFGDYDDAPTAAAGEKPEDAQAAAQTKDDDLDDDLDGDEPAAQPTTEGKADEAAAAAPAPQGADEAAQTTQEAAVEAPAPAQYQTITREELKAKHDDILTKKDKAFEAFDEGMITREDYLKQTRELDGQLLQLATHSALIEANEQNRIAAQNQKLEAIKADAKKAGTIDYNTDESAASEFDAAFQFVAAVPANAKLSFNDLADKAHKMVLAQRGIAAPQQAAAPAPPAPGPATPRVMPAAPITLSGLPNAETPNANGGVDEQLSRLHGLEFENAIARMPKDKRDAWMDS